MYAIIFTISKTILEFRHMVKLELKPRSNNRFFNLYLIFILQSIKKGSSDESQNSSKDYGQLIPRFVFWRTTKAPLAIGKEQLASANWGQNITRVLYIPSEFPPWEAQDKPLAATSSSPPLSSEEPHSHGTWPTPECCFPIQAFYWNRHHLLPWEAVIKKITTICSQQKKKKQYFHF